MLRRVASSPRPGPRARLALLVCGLLAAFIAFSVLHAVSRDQVRSVVAPFGAAAPLAYVAIAALLGAALVPGAILAAASGVLFGTALGTAVSLGAAVGSASVAFVVARAAGRGAVGELSGPRLRAVETVLARNGLGAVVAQRLMPAVPDAPCSYAAALLGVRWWQLALGTLIGAAPRAFSYSALGASLDHPSSAGAVIAIVVLVLTALVGAELARRGVVAFRRDDGANDGS
jgi:uncharacterized membrane protein YdjX (TVP38/TMEM64 family)